MSEILLSVDSEDPGEGFDELMDLRSWLHEEPELRGRVEQVASGPGEGQLGALTDLLAVALGSGGAISVLASSLRVFFAQPRKSKVSISLRVGPGGRAVKIDADRVKDVESILQQALEWGRPEDAEESDEAEQAEETTAPGESGGLGEAGGQTA